MKDHFHDICNCPECHYYDTEKPYCCSLPEQIKKKDIPPTGTLFITATA